MSAPLLLAMASLMAHGPWLKRPDGPVDRGLACTTCAVLHRYIIDLLSLPGLDHTWLYSYMCRLPETAVQTDRPQRRCCASIVAAARRQ